jgi:hypothetical protein
MSYRVDLLAPALLGSLFLSPAFAQEAPVPDMKGTWIGTTHAVHIGHMPHRRATREGHNFGGPLELRITITEQEHILFTGKLYINDKVETLIGSINPDSKNGIALDDDGQIMFTLSNPDKMDACYSHMDENVKAAACFTLTRSK